MNFTEYLELHEKEGSGFNQKNTIQDKIAVANKSKEIADNEKGAAIEAKKSGDTERKARQAEKENDPAKVARYRRRSKIHAEKSREHQRKQIDNRPVGSRTYNVKGTPHRLAKRFDKDVKSGTSREELAKRALSHQQESVRLTFTDYLEYLDSAVPPLYQVEGKLPQCPPGYVWNAERKDCLPKTEKDKINGKLNDKNGAYSGAHYNVWGKTGLNGDGYAYEDPPGTDINSSHWDKGLH